MPLFSLATNQKIEDKAQVLETISRSLSEILSKSEAYIMVQIMDQQAMIFSGTDEPCAYIQLKSLGLPENNTDDLSYALCEMIEKTIQVPSHRIYIEFVNPERHLWGWNKGTF